ncbi:hypothetical protein H9P43_002400 [Blastocladiella emersonii ATCC 22665]|nr:hypothetical protein H9P43_002400 [Blastocladiella emersonii ATCC 22665]
MPRGVWALPRPAPLAVGVLAWMNRSLLLSFLLSNPDHEATSSSVSLALAEVTTLTLVQLATGSLLASADVNWLAAAAQGLLMSVWLVAFNTTTELADPFFAYAVLTTVVGVHYAKQTSSAHHHDHDHDMEKLDGPPSGGRVFEAHASAAARGLGSWKSSSLMIGFAILFLSLSSTLSWSALGSLAALGASSSIFLNIATSSDAPSESLSDPLPKTTASACALPRQFIVATVVLGGTLLATGVSADQSLRNGASNIASLVFNAALLALCASRVRSTYSSSLAPSSPLFHILPLILAQFLVGFVAWWPEAIDSESTRMMVVLSFTLMAVPTAALVFRAVPQLRAVRSSHGQSFGLDASSTSSSYATLAPATVIDEAEVPLSPSPDQDMETVALTEESAGQQQHPTRAHHPLSTDTSASACVVRGKVRAALSRHRTLVDWLGALVAVTFLVSASLQTYVLRSSINHATAGRDPCHDLKFERRRPEPSPGTKVLVTGGSGFIGSNLVESLLDLGYKVRVFDNLSTGYISNIANLSANPDFEFMYGDILDKPKVAGAIDGVDYVYHLAAMSKVAPSMKDPDMAKFCLDTNVYGTINVLNASRNANVKKVVYAASSTYYGNGKVPMSEIDAPNLLTPYAATKYEGETQMEMYDNIFGLKTVSVRFFMVYGPRQPTSGGYAIVTGIFVDKLKQGVPLPIEGDGSHYRDFIHVKDIGESLILAQQSPLHGLVINSGTGVGHSVHEVADLVSPEHRHVGERRNDLIGTLADTCKAKKLLGFRAERDFTTEMRQLIHDALHPEDVAARPEIVAMVKNLAATPWLLPPGTLEFRYRPLARDLSALAHAAFETSAAASKQLSVVPYRAAHRRITENLVYSLVKHGKSPAILLVVDDDASLEECHRSLNMPCFDARAFSASGKAEPAAAVSPDSVPAPDAAQLDGGGDDEVAPLVSWTNMRVAYELTRLGFSVHLTRPDMAYVRDVWSSYSSYLDPIGADVAMAWDKGAATSAAELDAAMYRATPGTQAFLRAFLSSEITSNDDVPAAWTRVLATNAEFCLSREACRKASAAGKAAVRDYTTVLPHNIGCGETPDVCERAVLYVHPRCPHPVGPGNATLATVNALRAAQTWFMSDATCAPGNDLCLGIPKSMIMDADKEPALECFGTAAQLHVR